jgi:hypothetical protein
MKKKNLLFLFTFSIISQFLNIFKYNNIKIHNSLYLSNILSLFGFCIMIYLYPLFFYNKYNWLLGTNVFTFNFICIIIHILPIYFFKNKQNINKINIESTLADTILLLLLYNIIFKYYLRNNLYPFNELELLVLSISILFLLLFYYKNIN